MRCRNLYWRISLSSKRCSCEQLPCFVLPEARERRFLRGHLRTSDLDLQAEEETAAVSVSALPPMGKRLAESRQEIEREGAVRLPPLCGQRGRSLASQQFRAPQVQQRFPPLRNTTQEREKAQPGKISSKETSKASHLPPIEKGRTVAAPAAMAVPSAQSLRARQVLETLESYKVCREGWRKKVDQNRLLPARPTEHLCFVKKMELQEARGKHKNV
ncbi:hypothetical protein CIB84_015606 [Bambusicola thoracicus]|uniref:Uncharacterized protein n=1 Tax=Bambusicola thoracicus TaxID=9083 RepID=A0A2P4S974_BAMTH|nr:hypothetical protein CIB84_015606 [Bambusicola thoracicus]